MEIELISKKGLGLSVSDPQVLLVLVSLAHLNPFVKLISTISSVFRLARLKPKSNWETRMNNELQRELNISI